MSLETRIVALAQAFGADVKALFRLSVPAGGTTGQVLAKTSNIDNEVAWQTISGGGLTKGVAIVDFGLTGSDVATVTVPNTSVTDLSQIIVDLNPSGTADNDADEHFTEPATPRVTARVPGVSFDISMASTDQTKLFGTWSINWALVA